VNPIVTIVIPVSSLNTFDFTVSGTSTGYASRVPEEITCCAKPIMVSGSGVGPRSKTSCTKVVF
jgi:hypothetical protein